MKNAAEMIGFGIMVLLLTASCQSCSGKPMIIIKHEAQEVK